MKLANGHANGFHANGHARPRIPLPDRPPPYNLEAERSVLAACMMDDHAADDCCMILRPDDFFRPEHEETWRVIMGLRDEGEVPTGLAVSDRLERLGLFEKLGGNEYLEELFGSVPHAANATYHAGIVREKAVARKLIEAATELLKACYSLQHTAPELIKMAEESVFAIAEREVGSNVVDMEAIVAEALERIKRRQRGEFSGIKTGFVDLDYLLGGMRPGSLAILAARPSIGKAQPLDAKVLTPFGFIEMGSLKPGNLVAARDGRWSAVVGVFPQGEMPVFRVTMTDGSSTECTEDHLWFTQTRNERRRDSAGSVKTLREIMMTLEREGGGPNHRLPSLEPVRFAPSDGPLPLDPYLLGLLLGDATLKGTCVRFTNPEPDLTDRLSRLLPPGDAAVSRVCDRCPSVAITKGRRGSDSVSATRAALEKLGLYGSLARDKFIPPSYLHADAELRLSLLRGILDTDGHVCGSGMIVEYTTASPRLAEGVAFLVRSLGGIARTTVRVPAYSYRGESRTGADSHRMHISFPNGTIPVSSAKHLARWRSRTSRHARSIASVEPVGLKECQCIKVTAEDSLYVTDDFIVTHNTALGMAIATNVGAAMERPPLFVSLEMNRDELGDRLMSAWAEIDGYTLRSQAKNLGDPDRGGDGWERLYKAAGRLARVPIRVDDTALRTVSQVAATARRVKRQSGLAMVVIDYLGLIDAQQKARESTQEATARVSKRLKQMARELGVVVLALHQLNREVEKRDDRRPRLSDLRDSGQIEADADAVMLLHRPEFYDPNDQPGIANVIVAKNRNGATGMVELAFRKEWARFDSISREPEPGIPDDRPF